MAAKKPKHGHELQGLHVLICGVLPGTWFYTTAFGVGPRDRCGCRCRIKTGLQLDRSSDVRCCLVVGGILLSAVVVTVMVIAIVVCIAAIDETRLWLSQLHFTLLIRSGLLTELLSSSTRELNGLDDPSCCRLLIVR